MRPEFLQSIVLVLALAECATAWSQPLETPARWIRTGTEAGAQFGSSVAGVGDVNNDGYDDIVVGVPYCDQEYTDEGCAYLFLGGAAGISAPTQVLHPADQADAHFGASVGAGGHVSNDAYADVVIGAPQWSWSDPFSGTGGEGRAYLFLGNASGLSLAPSWTANPTNTSQFGASVSGAGDVDNNGYDDVVVGAPGAFSFAEGSVYLFLSYGGLLAQDWAWVAYGGEGDFFGASVSGFARFDSDAYADVFIGAPDFEVGCHNGVGQLHKGNASGLSDFAYLARAEGAPCANQWFGATGYARDDFDEDGFTDLLVGAPGIQMAYLFNSDGSWVDTASSWSCTGATTVSGTGDVNGDGRPDVIVGLEGWNNQATEEGRAQLYLGRTQPYGVATTVAWTDEPTDWTGAHFGQAVAGAGDVDGDGNDDVIVSAPDWGSGGEGRVFVYKGLATACTPGEGSTRPCGVCGVQSRTCGDTGAWGAWGSCGAEGVCSPSSQQACGNCGTQTCTIACQWDACTGEGECTPATNQACGSCGSQECTDSCEWGACEGDGDCPPEPSWDGPEADMRGSKAIYGCSCSVGRGGAGGDRILLLLVLLVVCRRRRWRFVAGGDAG